MLAKSEHISITPQTGRVKVSYNGEVIAETTNALALAEGKIPNVLYIPRGDVRMNLLERTDHQTHCPFKGDASYYTVKVGDQEAVNAVWSYESAISDVSKIRSYLAFYPDQVQIELE